MFFLLENEVDGSVLMDDNFDEAKIQELIPKMKHRISFIKERKKLRFVSKLNNFKLQTFCINREKESTTSESPVVNTSDSSKKFIETVRTMQMIYDCIAYYLD